MPGLNVTIDPLVTQSKPYPTSVVELVQRIKAQGSMDVAQALLLLQKSTEDLHRTLRQSVPAVRQVVVTDLDGNIVGQIGELPTTDGRILYGGQFIELYVGDVLGTRDPQYAPFYADASGNVFIGRNGSVDVLDPYGSNAAWLGTQFDTFPVTGAANNGAGLIRLTVTGHTLLTGDTPRVLNVGGVPNATGLWTITKIDANHIDLQNSVWDGAFTSGGTVDRILHVTGAVTSGGLIRLTVTAHGYESGDQVSVASVGGVPNATGQWIITVIDANHFNLRGSTFAGAYSSGGVVIRYAAGGNFQNIAIGTSFWNYHLRAFQDGTLKIKDALITLVGSGNPSSTITLDPATGTVSVKANSPGTLESILDAGGLTLFSQAGAAPGTFINGNSLVMADTVSQTSANPPTYTVAGKETDVLPGEIAVKNSLGNIICWLGESFGLKVAPGTANEIFLDASNGNLTAKGNVTGHKLFIDATVVIDNSLNAKNLASVDSAAYKVSGTFGIAHTGSYLTGITFGTAAFVVSINFATQTYTTQLGYISSTPTFESLTFDAGLLTGAV